MSRYLLIAINFAVSFGITACFYLGEDTSHEANHQRFIRGYRSLVGTDIRNWDPKLLPGRQVANNLMEVSAKLIRKDCVIYYQYDPNTFIVKNWHWEGAQCTMSP